MENLYKSLYDDIIHNDCDGNSDISVIEKILGGHDLNALSKYFSFEEYTSVTDPLTNNYINIIHINIRSLQKNFDLLKSMLNCFPKQPDIIAITETWLKDSTKHLYSMDGYTSFHLVRTQREHGGISVFVKDEINAVTLGQYYFVDEHIELHSLKIKINTLEYVIATIYRPHSKHIDVHDFTDILIEILTNDIFRCYNTILLGDFNINLLEHTDHLPTNIFLNAMQALNYFPHISRPTRFPDSPQLGQPSLLDQIWTNFTPPSLSGIFYTAVYPTIFLYSLIL